MTRGVVVTLSATLLAAALAGAPGARAGGDRVCTADDMCPRQLFVDVHELTPGGVTLEAVAEAHARDLEIQDRHGVTFERY